jgi:hypothetical protein
MSRLGLAARLTPAASIQSAQGARWSPRAGLAGALLGIACLTGAPAAMAAPVVFSAAVGSPFAPPSTNCTLITHATLAGGTSTTARQRLRLILPPAR